MRLLIKNGLVVNFDSVVPADIATEGERVTALFPHGKPQYAQSHFDAVIDADGCLVFPGFIDTHTHFDLDLGYTRTADDFITGSRAALLGGTTCVLDFATQEKDRTLTEAYDKWMEKAKNSYCNYGFHMAITSWSEKTEAEMDAMTELGVTSYKLYMAYDDLRLNDGEIYSAMKAAWKRGAICGVHCENWDLALRRIDEYRNMGLATPIYHALSHPSSVEAEAVARLARIAEFAGTPCYVAHLSTQEGLNEILRARRRGVRIYAETCPQYLLLTDECYNRTDGIKYIMNPPLRSASDNNALWKAAEAGDIDFIGTDHCSFNMEQRARGSEGFWLAPSGVAGVYDRARLIYAYGVETGRITLCNMAELLSHRAAQLFGMPRYGFIGEGAQADIVIWNTEAHNTLSDANRFHNCDNSPYSGLKLSGAAKYVIMNGKIAVADGRITGDACGRYIARRAFSKEQTL